jgi:hypothetical protein
MKNQNQNQNGAGFFFKSDKKPDFFKLFKEALSSEGKLLNHIKDYNEFMVKYQEYYKKHINNLDKLDDYFDEDEINFNSFHKSFNIIYTDIEKNINNNTFDIKNTFTQPLLLKNYNDLESYFHSEDIIEYHFKQQIDYLLDNNYDEEDRLLIRQVAFRNIMEKPEFKVFSIENKMTEFLPLQHHNYQIDYTKMKDVFDQVILYIKSVLPDSYSFKAKSKLIHKSKKKSIKFNKPKFNKPKFNNNNNHNNNNHNNNNNNNKNNNNKNIEKENKKVKKETKKSEKKVKKESKKEIKKSEKSKKEKKESKKVKKELQDIIIPINEPVLPIFKINMPKKIE